MHDVLRQRLMRRIESLPDGQVYQVLDFIEFLESKYSERHLQAEASTLQRLAENVEDRIRKKAMNPATLREAFQLISTADRVLSNVSAAGRQIIDDLGTLGELPESEPGSAGGRAPDRERRPTRPPGVGRPPPTEEGGGGASPTPPAEEPSSGASTGGPDGGSGGDGGDDGDASDNAEPEPERL